MSGAATLGLRLIHIILKHATTRKKASVYFELWKENTAVSIIIKIKLNDR